MKTTSLVVLTIVALLFQPSSSHAAKGAELKPALAKPGKLVCEESFAGKELPKRFTANKGDWQIKDGALTGKEKKEDEHAAVLTLAEPNRNSLIQFSFKLDGASGFNLSLNHAKGHLFRIPITSDGLSILRDKDKKDPNSKGETLGKAEGKFASGQWHTLLVEIKGDKVCVQADNGVKLEASHKELDVDKTGYRFVTRGQTLLLDDLKVWQAAP